MNVGIINNFNGLKWDVSFNIVGYIEEIMELVLKDENGNLIDDVGN